MVRFTALLLAATLIAAGVVIARGLWQLYAGTRDGQRARSVWGGSNVALGAGTLTAAYGIVPAAEIFILSTPIVAVLVAGFAIGIDLRVRRQMLGNRLRRRLTGAPARPPLGKRTGGTIKTEGARR
ncbi:hypothetical protein CKO28_25130 [Rhodovibrio sodomensis]|uniref:Uncharacterized protein n=1 Tax=Rhodovibrio sodomensis TaxID=1088 RepID=A0ABS1DMY2_9PROT|nr:hypothetical protein [Rhodovibrio sodomensis]MBK1671287.1 hypothetical protein [Rhodovibrio sodomensis]